MKRSDWIADNARRDITFDGSFDVGDESNWLARPVSSVNNAGTGSGFAATTSEKRTGTHSGAFTAGVTDGISTNRSEILAYLGSTQGDDDYFAWSTKFPSAPASWANILQLFAREFTIANRVMFRFLVTYAGAGPGPATGFYLVRNPVTVQTPGASETTHNLNVPIAIGSWHDFVLRIKWDIGTSGVVQCWHRLEGSSTWTQVLNLTGTRTLQSRYDSGAEPATVNIRHGLYRSEAVDIARTVYHDCFVRAATLDAAKQAFVATPNLPTRKLRASRGAAVGEVATFDQVNAVTREKRNGVLAPTLGAFTSLGWISNTVYGFRYYNREQMQLRKITFVVSTPSSGNDPFDLVIFNSTGTAELLRITGKLGLLNSGGLKTLSATADFTDIPLAADTVYNVLWAAPQTGSGVIWARTIGTGTAGQLLGTVTGDQEFFSKTSSYPIAADMSAINASNAAAVVPVFGLRDA